MLSTVARRAAVRTSNPARAFSAVSSPWGSDAWRHDKKAFVQWCTDAVNKDGQAKREFYGFCALSFGDVDTDKDGFINLEQFDRLLEKVAAVPRRYGLAPLANNDYTTRLLAHKQIFDKLDTQDGPARGVLGLDQFIQWSWDHIAVKVTQIPEGDVGLYHVQDYSEAEYIGFIERAVNNPGSYEHSSFYNFILNCFVEADSKCQGRVTYEQFSTLLTRAAVVPRHFGLAPTDVDESVRKEMFASMELKRNGVPQGFVTMRKFWEWTVPHVKAKIELQKAGKGWRENK